MSKDTSPARAQMLETPMKRVVLLGLLASACIVIPRQAIAAASIGASFIGRNATPQDRLARNEVAGAEVQQPYWNNIADDGTTFKGISNTLLDNSGNFTSVR